MTTLVEVSTETATTSAEFQRYYEEAGPDYAAWSKAFNMHFGFFRWGMNPFRRETMLEEMNRQVFDRLHLESELFAHVRPRILDMGCGLGATLRSVARRLPCADLIGITLVPWQLEQGRLLNDRSAGFKHITLNLGDYERTVLPPESFDAVYALESSCYARGANKSVFLQEAHRVLRPGGRIIVADGFLGPGKLRGPQKHICRTLCDCWVIDTLGEVDAFQRELERLGFRNIIIEQMQLA